MKGLSPWSFLGYFILFSLRNELKIYLPSFIKQTTPPEIWSRPALNEEAVSLQTEVLPDIVVSLSCHTQGEGLCTDPQL